MRIPLLLVTLLPIRWRSSSSGCTAPLEVVHCIADAQELGDPCNPRNWEDLANYRQVDRPRDVHMFLAAQDGLHDAVGHPLFIKYWQQRRPFCLHAFEHACVDVVWTDARGANVLLLLSHLHVQGLGDADRPKFGSTVVHQSRRAKYPGSRGNRDDMAVVALYHGRKERFQSPEMTDRVDVHGADQSVIRAVQEFPPRHNASVVDEDVDGTNFSRRSVHGLSIRHVDDVHGAAAAVLVDLADHLLQPFRIDVPRHHASPFLGKSKCHQPPNAAPSPCDQHDLVAGGPFAVKQEEVRGVHNERDSCKEKQKHYCFSFPWKIE